MACVLVPAAEAVVVTVINKTVGKKKGADKDVSEAAEKAMASFHEKMNWLQNMLWGGSALLAFEHIWHGEVTAWFPFLTAAESQAGLAEMFQEMATTGVSMAVLVTAVWGAMVLGAGVIEKRAAEKKLTR